MFRLSSTTTLLTLSVFLLSPVTIIFTNAGDYGLDCSFPIHNDHFTCDSSILGNGPKERYQEFMRGCKEKWGVKGAARCIQNEKDRFEMSKRQPQSMVNYTSTGFKKIKAPPELWDVISSYWKKNKGTNQKSKEEF